jgi:hypothetical protein
VQVLDLIISQWQQSYVGTTDRVFLTDRVLRAFGIPIYRCNT